MSAMDKIRRSREAGEFGPTLEAVHEQLRALSEETERLRGVLQANQAPDASVWTETQAAAASAWETAVAERIEPLAQSMVVLSSEVQGSIEQLQANSQAQARQWSEAQARSAEALSDSARDVQAAASEMRRTTNGWNWTVWTGVLLAAIGPMAVLLIASLLWLPHGWALIPDGNGRGLYLQVYETPPARQTAPPTQ